MSNIRKMLAVVATLLGSAIFTGQSSSLATLRTRAERSEFTETSRYDDVISFLDVVDRESPLVHVTSFGYSFEGRSLPLAVVGKVADAKAETVRASGRLRVYIQANIHAGEVEGKEAALALIRELARGRNGRLDGAARQSDLQRRWQREGDLTSRGFQQGPMGGQGTRANAQGLNINRDNIKLDTPEARSMVRLLNAFDPHVMIDLHTTNGSRHAYHLTYETPNNPAVDPAIVAEGRAWMGALRAAIKKTDGWEFHAYGNVSGEPPDRIWRTVEDLPRYTHNYWGVRNRIGILSETYSYLPFRDRVITNQRFLEELLGYAHVNAARLQALATAADKTALAGQRVSLRSRPARAPNRVEILMGEVEEDVNPFSGRVLHKRLDMRRPEQMWEEATFESTETERVPQAYFVPADEKVALERLRAHGIALEKVEQAITLPLEEFRIASTETTPQPFENHQERTVSGQYVAVERQIPAGAYRVSMSQPLARLAFYLLEARSNDGLLTWNVFDEAVKRGTHPILRSRD